MGCFYFWIREGYILNAAPFLGGGKGSTQNPREGGREGERKEGREGGRKGGRANVLTASPTYLTATDLFKLF